MAEAQSRGRPRKAKNEDTVMICTRVDRSIRELFHKVVAANDDDAAKVLRRLIKKYINDNQQGGLI